MFHIIMVNGLDEYYGARTSVYGPYSTVEKARVARDEIAERYTTAKLTIVEEVV